MIDSGIGCRKSIVPQSGVADSSSLPHAAANMATAVRSARSFLVMVLGCPFLLVLRDSDERRCVLRGGMFGAVV